MKLTKVTINGVTVKDTDSGVDPKTVIRWEYVKDGDAISEAEILVTRDINDLLDLSNGLTVEIFGGTTTSTDRRFFFGKIDTIKPDGATFIINCSNEMIDLVRKNVNKIYDSDIDPSAGEVSEIVEDLIQTFGGLTASVQPSGTADGERVDEFKCVNTDIYERIFTLKKALDWDLFYDDSTRIVHFEPKGFTDSGKTLTVKQEILGIPEWDIDTSNMINDLRVEGATIESNITENGQIGVTSGYETGSILLDNTPNSTELLIDSSNPPTTQREGGSKDASSTGFYYMDRENKKLIPATGTSYVTNDFAIVNYIWSSPVPIHQINQASIDEFGLFQTTIELNDITSVADAESRTTSILSRRSIPFITGKIKVKLTDVPNRGEMVQIVDDITPTVKGQELSGQYHVNSIRYMFPSAFEEIEVGDSQWRLADWQQTTEERLIRLEEQFVRNQDLLSELVEISNNPSTNFKKIIPRYRKVRNQDYDPASGISMLGFGTADGYFDLGSGKFGTFDNAFDPEEDHFIQQYLNSYTENFVDEDFFDDIKSTADWLTGIITTGQTLRSTSVDFNNSIVTTSTPIFTGSGAGIPTFYLMADGANWEVVANSVAHVFANTGTDLRWRVDSAAGTFTLTKVEINSYH